MGRHTGGSAGQKSNWPPIIIVKEEIQKNPREKSKWPPLIIVEEEIQKNSGQKSNFPPITIDKKNPGQKSD